MFPKSPSQTENRLSRFHVAASVYRARIGTTESDGEPIMCGIVSHCGTQCDSAWSVSRNMQAEEANLAHLAYEYTKHPCAAALAWSQLGTCARALPDLSATLLAHDAGRICDA